MNWDKIGTGFFQDLDEIGSIVIESEERLDKEKKDFFGVFVVVGITKFGQRLPLPLHEAKDFESAEAYVNAFFVKKK